MNKPTVITVTIPLGSARMTGELLAAFLNACEPSDVTEILDVDFALVQNFANCIAGPVYGSPLGDALRRIRSEK